MDDNNGSIWKIPIFVFFRDARLVFKRDSLAKEIIRIALPAAIAVAADPIASLIDTAFIGHLGPVELAAAGVSIALFNQASKITIFPLISVTTSFVAEEDTLNKTNNLESHENQLTENNNDEGNNNNNKDYEVVANYDNDHFQDIEECDAYNNKEEDRKIRKKSLDANDETLNKFMATSTVTEDLDTDSALKNETNDDNTNICKPKFGKKSKSKSGREKLQLASASTALLFATILGLSQAAILIFADKPLLRVMGVKRGSPMLGPASKYLRVRSLGAPAMLLSVGTQGILRGFKDTITPLYVVVSGYALNIALDPLLIYHFKLGLIGAAIAHVISQYFMALVILLVLMNKLILLPPSLKDLQIFRFLKNGGLLIAKVIAVTSCVTLSASMAARLGPIPMAAFQACLQVWLTASLLADGLAVAVQAIIASSFAEKDYDKVIAATLRTLHMTFVLGIVLSLVVGIGLYFGAGIFSKSVPVLHLIRIAIPFVAATQPINSLAFVFDGVNYGASDFAYSAYSLVMVAIVSLGSLFLLYKSKGFVGIWISLSIYMSLRMFASVFRMGTGSGPWRFLRIHS